MTRSACLWALALSMLLGVAYLFSASSSAAQDKGKEAPAVRWEYKVVPIANRAELVEKDLNALGAEGWEVAGTAREGVHLILKRRK